MLWADVCEMFLSSHLVADGVFAPSDRDKDLLPDEKGADPHTSLMEYLAANDFDLIGHSNSPQEKMASGMVDERELNHVERLQTRTQTIHTLKLTHAHTEHISIHINII